MGRPGKDPPSLLSEGADPADPLPSDLWPAELRADTFPLFKQSDWWHCVKAALGNASGYEVIVSIPGVNVCK